MSSCTMADIVIVGSCVQDMISYVERYPKPGESVRGSKFQMGFGGKGANQAITASRLGAKCAMIAKVGDDLFGAATIKNFVDHNINAENVSLSKDASTATAAITVTDDGENRIVVVLGANELLSQHDVAKAENLIKQSKVMVCQLEIPTEVTLFALKLAKKHGVMTIFNPAPGLPNIPDELLNYSDFLCPNENEAEFLSGLKLECLDDANVICSKLLDKGAKTVIITLGAKGCVLASGDDRTPRHIACPIVKAKDTTGAGDAFVGSLAYYIAEQPELSLAEKVRRSSEIASVSVQYAGTQTSYLYKKDLDPALFAP